MGDLRAWYGAGLNEVGSPSPPLLLFLGFIPFTDLAFQPEHPLDGPAQRLMTRLRQGFRRRQSYGGQADD
jgi:hypothetical protein